MFEVNESWARTSVDSSHNEVGGLHQFKKYVSTVTPHTKRRAFNASQWLARSKSLEAVDQPSASAQINRGHDFSRKARHPISVDLGDGALKGGTFLLTL